jgi:hypothetical protein
MYNKFIFSPKTHQLYYLNSIPGIRPSWLSRSPHIATEPPTSEGFVRIQKKNVGGRLLDLYVKRPTTTNTNPFSVIGHLICHGVYMLTLSTDGETRDERKPASYDDGKGTDVSRANTRTGQQEGRFRERHPMGPQIGPF